MGLPTITVNPTVDVAMIFELREAVGWGGLAADYPAALAGYWATVGGFDAGGELAAWCAILSDGVRPRGSARRAGASTPAAPGVGRALVAQALTHIRAHGITIIHVDFLPERAVFYERCGFRVGLGGIYEAR